MRYKWASSDNFLKFSLERIVLAGKNAKMETENILNGAHIIRI